MGLLRRIYRSDAPDDLWAEFYLRLLATGRERASFYGREREDVPGFVRRVRNSPGPWWLLTWAGELAGCMYITDITGTSGQMHFAYLPLPALRHPCGEAGAVALSRFGLASVLHDAYQDGSPMLDVVVGITPVWNRAAVKMLPRMGGTVLGEIPSCCFCADSGRNGSGVISYFTRDTVPQTWANL